jgi:TRAP-type C4-dicarboxylate transport system permease large subunit
LYALRYPGHLRLERIGAELWIASAQLGKNVDQARRESDEFFRLTLFFAGLGLALMLIGIVLFFLRQTTACAVSAMAATILEAIVALLFKKDRELRDTIGTYHQQMLESQQLLLMVEAANTMEVQGDRDRMKRSIIYRALNITSIDAESKT